MRTKAVATVAALAAAWAVPGAAAWAGKPSGGGGGVDAGLVYFNWQGTTRVMNPDGSGKAALPVPNNAFNSNDPSRATHGGHRWFLRLDVIAGQTLPTGAPKREVFAMRDDGAEQQLTFTANDVAAWSPRWAPGDGRLAWFVFRWNGSAFTPDGWYVADVALDVGGDVAGLVAQPTSASVAAGGSPFGCDWSPDGTRFATADGGVLRIADVATGASTTLSTVRPAYDPAWSPDGALIAYDTVDANNVASIRSVGAGGANDTVVLAGSARSSLGYRVPVWSPQGTNLIFERDSVQSGAARTDVCRSTATGGSVTSLTGDLDTRTSIGGGGAAIVRGWR